MSHLSGSAEDAAKQRARDGKMRREEGDETQPEEKRLRLGNEGGSIRKEEVAGGRGGGGEGQEEDTERMPCLNREESGTQTDGDSQTVSRTVSTHFPMLC